MEGRGGGRPGRPPGRQRLPAAGLRLDSRTRMFSEKAAKGGRFSFQPWPNHNDSLVGRPPLCTLCPRHAPLISHPPAFFTTSPLRWPGPGFDYSRDETCVILCTFGCVLSPFPNFYSNCLLFVRTYAFQTVKYYYNCFEIMVIYFIFLISI